MIRHLATSSTQRSMVVATMSSAYAFNGSATANFFGFNQASGGQRFGRITCCVAQTPPSSLQDTISVASQAISEALDRGHKRILITTLIPGLNPALEQTFPFSASLLNSLSQSLLTENPVLQQLPSSCLLFPSSGTAAAASVQYQRDGTARESIRTASFSRRDITDNRTSTDCNVIINPISFRGDPVMDDLETVIGENPSATWVLLNPQLGNDRAAVGMRESSRRAAFLNSFTNTFYLRPLFEIQRPVLNAVERGSLLFTFGQPWRVFALVDDKYVLAEEYERMPTAEELTSAINRCELKAQRDKAKNEPSGLDVEIKRLFGFLGPKDDVA